MKLVETSFWADPDPKTFYVSVSAFTPHPEESKVPVSLKWDAAVPSRELRQMWRKSAEDTLAQAGFVQFYRRELERNRDRLIREFRNIVDKAREADVERLALVGSEGSQSFCPRRFLRSWLLNEAAKAKQAEQARTEALDAAVDQTVAAADEAAAAEQAKRDERNARRRARYAERKAQAAA